MKYLINYFIHNSLAANLLMIALFILGIFGLLRMKSTFFPEVPSRNISVQLVYPGASPEEMEEGVINKIEENLKAITGIERVTSISRENSGSVNVEVERGYNTDLVLQDVKNGVDQINSFPDGLEAPVVFKLESLGFAINFALSGNVPLDALKKVARKVEDDLRAIDGVSKVSLAGFPEEEIEIAFREKDLEAYQLTFSEAATAVRNANIEITGGSIKGESEELLLRANNKSYYAEGLRDIVVKTTDQGGFIRLFQVADIKDKWSDNPNRTYLNGNPSVVVTVQNTLEEDMITITDEVKEYLAGFNAKESQAIKAEVVRDGSTILRQRISLLTRNGLQGFFIVLVLLAMFLNWRLAFWVALAIPISFAGMFICAYLLDVTINVLSLFGMILVIGILVDDGIVISESIYQEYERGVPRWEASIQGTMKVLPAVFSAIITTIFAFSAFFFIEGRLGDFFAELSIVVILSLIFSLVEGALILPNHVGHSKALAPNKKKYWLPLQFEAFMNWLRDKLYGPSLALAMRNPVIFLCLIVGLLFLSIGAIQGGFIKTTFFPIIERDNMTIELQMPAGTRDYITQEWLDHIEAAAWRVNERLSNQIFNGEKQAILQVQKTIGPSSYQGQVDITLLDGENRDPLKARDIINAVRKETGPIPEAELVAFGQQNAFGKPVSLSLVGEDYGALQRATEEVKQNMKGLAELTDVIDNNQEGLKEINIDLTEKARYLGISLLDILGQVRQGFFGAEVQRLQRGRDEVKVWVRYDEADRGDIDQLKEMRIRLPGGRAYPLSELANLHIERGVININHIDGKREIKLEADVANDQVSVSDITTNLKEELVPSVLRNYPSVSALYEGQNREQEKTTKSMPGILLMVGFLMFMSIALTFGSVSQTLIVFGLIPFGIIGTAFGHWVMAKPLSLFSFLGLIALVGILVNDALVFVTTYNAKIKSGMPQMKALYETGVERFRPILLTSITTIAGLAPLLFEKSLQAQFLIPMAISVAFGLLVITLIILILLPVLLIVTNRIKVYTVGLVEGQRPAYRTVEPAYPNRQSYLLPWLVGGVLSLAAFVGIIALLIRIISNLG